MAGFGVLLKDGNWVEEFPPILFKNKQKTLVKKLQSGWII